MFKFIPNRLALVVLISASSIILISMGLRQTFGLFFSAFEEGLGCTRTEFGLAIGIQMLFWGMFAPVFGLIADKLGGNKAVFIGFIIFGIGIYMLYAGPNTGIFSDKSWCFSWNSSWSYGNRCTSFRGWKTFPKSK